MERRQFLVAAPASLLAAGGAVQSASAAPRSDRGSRSVSGDAQDALNALYRWSLGYDSRDVDLMRSAFTQDARFIFRPVGGVGQPTVFRGIDAVMKLFTDSLAAQTDTRRHVTTNSLVERVNQRTVKVTSYLTLIIIDKGVLRVQATGVYRDLVVARKAGDWRIKERDLTLDIPS
jgi:hypothetical protein